MTHLKGERAFRLRDVPAQFHGRRARRRNHALVPVVEVLVVLHFFASESFLQVISDTVGLSKSAVSNIITDVSEALVGKKQQFVYKQR